MKSKNMQNIYNYTKTNTMNRSERMKQIYRYNTGQDDYAYKCIETYKQVKNPYKWLVCPQCELIPKIWTFDNGRLTACGCGVDQYEHFSIYAESIMSHIKRNNGSALNYDSDELRKNWNHWVNTGEILFDRKVMLKEGKW
jgi:hypothetical protein